MAERPDDIDTWLSEPVNPLLPPPGTFDRIRRQSRQRRRRRVSLMSTGVAVVLAAAAVIVPRLAGTILPAGGSPAAGHPSVAPVQTTPPAGRTGGPAPSDVSAASVTFVGTWTGWVLGQSSSAGQCGRPGGTTCLLRTDDRGKTWRTVSPPPVGGPDGASGVSQIRFLNGYDGWAFGPQLWATHDAGRTWTQIPTNGLRVTALEARDGRVFAVWAHCTGKGRLFASHCDRFTFYSAPAGSNQWTRVPGVGVEPGPGGSGGSAQLVLTSPRAYLLPPDGVLLSGPVNGSARWQPVTGNSLPCLPGPAQADGQSSQAMLASNGGDLILLCVSGAGHQPNVLYSSSDSGQTWRVAGTPPKMGMPTSLAGTPSGATVVLATTEGIEVSGDGGASWQAARGARSPGGFAYLGMTTSTQGVAVPANGSGHAVWLTYNGGTSWQRSGIG